MTTTLIFSGVVVVGVLSDGAVGGREGSGRGAAICGPSLPTPPSTSGYSQNVSRIRLTRCGRLQLNRKSDPDYPVLGVSTAKT